MSKPEDWDIKKAIGHAIEPYEVKVEDKDLILYALGIGFQKDPLNAADFNFTYENADEFQSFPTIAVVMAHRGALTNAGVAGIGIPSFNPMMILHGEERVEIVSPIEAGTTVLVHEKLIDL
jgi:hypothetical protein